MKLLLSDVNGTSLAYWGEAQVYVTFILYRHR